MLARRLSAYLRRRVPRAHRALRRTYAFAEYARWRLAGRDDPAAEAYGAAFWNLHADAEWDWAGFAACIIRHTHPRGVVDVGCGDAKLLAAMRTRFPDLELRGYDGSPTARARAARRGISVDPLDVPRLSRTERSALRTACAGYDVALCLEVAEHLLPWHAGRLLDVLTACPTIVFSAARPGQGGTVHVNERPAAYWIRRFARLGYAPAAVDDVFRGELESVRVPSWYIENTHVFRRVTDSR
jgi:hypothetical protein